MVKKHTVIAICYDFDGTLAKGNIQENSFIPELGITKKAFWKEVGELKKKHEMDEILAYMYLLISKTKDTDVKRDRKSIEKHGESVKYFQGVEDYFDRINKYAKTKKITLEHYIISSGTKEMIEGTTIAKYFKIIYASSFMYDQHNIPLWPALAINYTTKTQYLFRINKGVENVWDNSAINKFTPEDKRKVPFEKMIYIGDGETDIPAMKMVNYQGGNSIAVYPENKKGAKDKALELLTQKRVSYVAKANYADGGEIDRIIKSIIDQTSEKEKIEKYCKVSLKKEAEKDSKK